MKKIKVERILGAEELKGKTVEMATTLAECREMFPDKPARIFRPQKGNIRGYVKLTNNGVIAVVDTDRYEVIEDEDTIIEIYLDGKKIASAKSVTLGCRSVVWSPKREPIYTNPNGDEFFDGDWCQYYLSDCKAVCRQKVEYYDQHRHNARYSHAFKTKRELFKHLSETIRE